MEKKCSVCNSMLDTDNAAILTIGGFGNPRYICKECESELDALIKGTEYDDIKEAGEKLTKKVMKNAVDDELVMQEMETIFNEAKIRAEQIKNGEYDFSSDESTPLEEDGDDVPEALLESEEDKELDRLDAEAAEKLEKRMKKVDIVFGAIFGAAIIAYVVYFVIKRFF